MATCTLLEDIEMSSPFSTTRSVTPVRQRLGPSPAYTKIKNDLADYAERKITTGCFDITLSNCYECDNGDYYFLYAEFKDLFKVVITFSEGYPYLPPTITYVSGEYTSDLFDMEQNLKIRFLSNKEWSTVHSVSSIIYSIELMLLKQQSSEARTLVEQAVMGKKSEEMFAMRQGRKKKYREFLKENGMNIPFYIGDSAMNFNDSILKKIKTPGLA